MKNIIVILLLLMVSSSLYGITADELLKAHRVTTTQMNNINSPQAGSIVYNTTQNRLFYYTGSVWKPLRATGSETILQAGVGIVINGDGTSDSPYTIGAN
jgi:hypothetical protein